MTTTTTLNLIRDAALKVSPWSGSGAPFTAYLGTTEWKSPTGANTVPPAPLPNTSLNAVYNGTDDFGLNYTFPLGTSDLAASTQYTFSAYVYTQTGNITFRLQAVTIAGSTEVELTHADQLVVPANTWTRMTITFTTPSDIASKNLILRAIMVTSAGFATRLRTQGWQLEQRGSSTPICDGSLPACGWVGTPYYSASTRTITTDIVMTGESDSNGAVKLRIIGAPIDMPEIQGMSASYGSITAKLVAIPDRSFDDFAHGKTGDYDPRMTVVPQGTVGVATTTTTWVRNWLRQTVPTEYPIPGGSAWKRATYASVGVKWPAVANNAAQYLDLVQLEKKSAAAPATYDPARTVIVKVKPERVNYITNPSFEVSTSGWVATGSNAPVIAQTPTMFKYGARSMKVSLAANPPAWVFLPWMGAQISIPGLTDGQTYVASAWVYREVGCPNVFTVIAGQGLGSGTPTSYTGVWERITIQFKKVVGSTPVLQILFDQNFMLAGQDANFYIDGVMCELATTARTDYFDGSFAGQDYLWDSLGTPQLTKSYYYSGRREKQYRLDSVIRENVPVGTQVRIVYTDTT